MRRIAVAEALAVGAARAHHLATVDADRVARHPVQARRRQRDERLANVLRSGQAAARVARLGNRRSSSWPGMRRSAGVSVTPARIALTVIPSWISSKRELSDVCLQRGLGRGNRAVGRDRAVGALAGHREDAEPLASSPAWNRSRIQ